MFSAHYQNWRLRETRNWDWYGLGRSRISGDYEGNDDAYFSANWQHKYDYIQGSL